MDIEKHNTSRLRRPVDDYLLGYETERGFIPGILENIRGLQSQRNLVIYVTCALMLLHFFGASAVQDIIKLFPVAAAATVTH